MNRAEANYDETLFGSVDADIYRDDEVAPSWAIHHGRLVVHLLRWSNKPGRVAAMSFELGLDERRASEIARELRISQPRFHQLRKMARAYIDMTAKATGGA